MKANLVVPLFISFILVLPMLSCSPSSFKQRRAKLLYEEGQILATQGEAEKAMERFESSLALAAEAGFSAGVAHNLNELAIIRISRGDYSEARGLLGEALKIYQRLNMEPEVSKCLNNLALTYVREGEFSEALVRYEELLAWDRATDNRLGAAITLNNMGLLLERHLGRREEAQRHYSQALEIFQGLGKKGHAESVRRNMGMGTD